MLHKNIEYYIVICHIVQLHKQKKKRAKIYKYEKKEIQTLKSKSMFDDSKIYNRLLLFFSKQLSTFKRIKTENNLYFFVFVIFTIDFVISL